MHGPAEWVASGMVNLGLTKQECRPVEPTTARKLLEHCRPNVTMDPSRNWWWECLAEPSFGIPCPNGDGPGVVASLVPSLLTRLPT